LKMSSSNLHPSLMRAAQKKPKVRTSGFFHNSNHRLV